ncbi:MAG TPA: ribosome biogenesis factor YjgA [Steroidobacteraceae bacterium]|nr:ribosome biogenesis factor YjgA [Steroidobacteraceae bacterium]
MGGMPSAKGTDDTGDAHDGPASKSARKRAADGLQGLGVELASLSDAEIATLDLPDSLLAALRELRRLTSHGAQFRQRQYIGKLMRRIDPQPLIARLAERKRTHDREVRAFQRIEHWRQRLLAAQPGAVNEFLAACPAADRTALQGLLAQARRERDAGRAPAGARALFAALKRWLG